jgi:periplasmic protein TonB
MYSSFRTDAISGKLMHRLTPSWFAISFTAHLVLFGALLAIGPGQVRHLAPYRILMVDIIDIAPPAASLPPIVKVQQPETFKRQQLPVQTLKRPQAPDISQPKRPSPVVTEPVPLAPVEKIVPSFTQAHNEQPAKGTPAPSHEQVRNLPAPVDSAASAGLEQKAARASAEGSARSRYLVMLRTIIEKYKEYPVMARRKRVEGTAVVHFILTRNGSLKEATIARSSGASLLDSAALSAIRAVGGFPPPPAEISGGEITLEVPLTYRLAGG